MSLQQVARLVVAALTAAAAVLAAAAWPASAAVGHGQAAGGRARPEVEQQQSPTSAHGVQRRNGPTAAAGSAGRQGSSAPPGPRAGAGRATAAPAPARKKSAPAKSAPARKKSAPAKSAPARSAPPAAAPVPRGPHDSRPRTAPAPAAGATVAHPRASVRVRFTGPIAQPRTPFLGLSPVTGPQRVLSLLRPVGDPIVLPLAGPSQRRADLTGALPRLAADAAEAAGRRPGLPFGVLALLLLFLLAQSSIDRRDPKLLAPIEDEEPLAFTDL